jgi:RNA polymerase subunit RPABC4/transcription elongation factor Spt4
VGISQCPANGSQNLNNSSAWLGKLIITMSLKSDYTRRRELEVGGKEGSSPRYLRV